MPILDRFGQPIRYVRRTDHDLDAEVALELHAEARRRADNPEIADNEAVAAEQQTDEAAAAQARKEEIDAARAEGKANGFAEGRAAGAAAVDARMKDIIAGAHGNGALAQAALELALDATDLSPAVALAIAGRSHGGSAALANRAALPDSLQAAFAQLKAEQAGAR